MNLLATILGLLKAQQLSQSVKATPSPLVSFHLSEARKRFQAGVYEGALVPGKEALSLDQTLAEGYRLRGVIKYTMQDTTGAVEDLRHSLTLS
jgi:hypothetical protein